MSVVENASTATATRNPQQQFALGSAIGAVALVAAFAIIFGAIPLYWAQGWEQLFADNKDMRENVFLSDALVILLDLCVIAGFAYATYRLLQAHPIPGLRAGMVIGALYLFFCAWLAFWIGDRLREASFSEDSPAVGYLMMAVIFALPVAAAGYVYLAIPGWRGFMETLEHYGFFHAESYKGNQGVRVRRGTIAGILAVGATGIVTMVTHRLFGYDRPDYSNDWYWTVPFSNPTQYVYLMFKVHTIMPILLGILLLWVAWRVVNIPAFADFLIATEAEMNKVSWTNRKRLVQDTIVVLVTVFLFTMFLFVVDIVWIKILNAPYIQVLIYDPKEKEKQQQETAKW